MPGAISRTTGSATRWNSFTPSFIRHGSVQPFSVTTGLYGRPFDGTNGACVAADDCIGASGSEAAPALVTMPAPIRVAAPVKKDLRSVMVVLLYSFADGRPLRPPDWLARSSNLSARRCSR